MTTEIVPYAKTLDRPLIMDNLVICCMSIERTVQILNTTNP